MPHRPIRATALGLAALAGPLLAVPLLASPGTGAAAPKTFERHDVDAAATGASFTALGEVFPGEKNIITSLYGELDRSTPGKAVPAGGGSLRVYRPGADLGKWTSFDVFGSEEEIIFPNRPTIVDMNGDGLNDLLLPSGYFFDTDGSNPGGAKSRSAITWWENKGLDGSGTPLGFVRHDIITGQPGSYHGVELVDLDGDGHRDIVTTAEAAQVADNQSDDTVTLQYLRGAADGTFSAPITLADGLGGSHPTVADINGDGALDIVSSQYFNISYWEPAKSSFLWFERTGAADASGALSAANFVPHSITTAGEAGFGFQIQPVPGFREPGKISWIGTNHQGRCFVDRIGINTMPGTFDVREMVMEFVPGDDITQPWDVVELSTPQNAPTDPHACDSGFNVSNSPVLIHPGDNITARSAGGQAAPGVFGHGDLDGDGDIDLAVSGDGDRRLFWIENRPGATPSTVLHTLTAPGEVFGQSGGAVVDDLDTDGSLDMVFSSFDTNTVAVWSAPKPPVVAPPTSASPTSAPSPTVTVSPLPVVTHPMRLRVSGPKRVVAGAKTTWKVRLTGSPLARKRIVTVTFKATGKRKATKLERVVLTKQAGKRGTFVWRPRANGVLTYRYAGAKISDTVTERAAKRTVRVKIRR